MSKRLCVLSLFAGLNDYFGRRKAVGTVAIDTRALRTVSASAGCPFQAKKRERNQQKGGYNGKREQRTTVCSVCTRFWRRRNLRLRAALGRNLRRGEGLRRDSSPLSSPVPSPSPPLPQSPSALIPVNKHFQHHLQPWTC